MQEHDPISALFEAELVIIGNYTYSFLIGLIAHFLQEVAEI
jgi:hypothetical protein